MGFGQSESIENYLENRKVSHLADELNQIKPKSSLVKELTCEEIVEKHAILDVMHYGKDLFNEFKDLEFKTSYKTIKLYADPMAVDRKKNALMRLLHYNCLEKYAKFAQ